jgi:hypothetical protein
MKNKIFLLIGILLYFALLSISNVKAIASYCGDGYCTNYGDEYNESNPLSIYYCPLDCGIQTSSTWCENTYTLIPLIDCPACGGCPTCDTSRISESNLNYWCLSHGFSIGSTNQTPPSTSSKALDFIKKYWYVFWIIFFVIGLIIGYYLKKNKRKRRR